jgi:hypothetical protein
MGARFFSLGIIQVQVDDWGDRVLEQIIHWNCHGVRVSFLAARAKPGTC